jgi:hypothetical protein
MDLERAQENSERDHLWTEISSPAAWVADLGLGEPLVHVIDCEADALVQYRAWQAVGQHFLVRAKGSRKVRWRGEQSRHRTSL